MTKNTLNPTIQTLNIKGRLFDLSRPKIMGVLNLTPDSFYAASRVTETDKILDKANEMLNNGADIIDIGGFSSRPGAEEVTEEEEISRVIEPIAELKKNFPNCLISLDTFRSKVARLGLEAGVDIINDISGGMADVDIMKVAGEFQVPYVLMHMRGYATNMMENTQYENLLSDIASFFNRQIEKLRYNGVQDVIIDPGFGFSKSLDQNYELLSNLQYFNMIKAPILVGLSRKSMIYKFLNSSPQEALVGTNVLNFAALQKGARILRVHDVKEAKETVALFEKLEG